MAKEVIVSADKVKKRKTFARVVRLALLIILLFLVVLYIILSMIYSTGKFTISLDSNKTFKTGLTIYDNLEEPVSHRKLEADSIKFMDNISYKMIPIDIDSDELSGSHNGDNYIAYTFFVENQGDEILDYWYEIIVDDVIKNVDEAIRIRIYHNGKPTTYAKKNNVSNEPEDFPIPTEPFKEIPDADDTIIMEKVEGLMPGLRDRITILVWLEGDDPDCKDPLIGGELKMHMVLTASHTGLKEE